MSYHVIASFNTDLHDVAVSYHVIASFNTDLHDHPLKCVQWPVLLGGALGRMFGGSSNFLLTFDRKSIYMIRWFIGDVTRQC